MRENLHESSPFREVNELTQSIDLLDMSIDKPAGDQKPAQQAQRISFESFASTVSLVDEPTVQDELNTKLIIIMVGLPARGKSYVTKKLCRYLNWLQYDTRIFNVGNRRRQTGRNAVPTSEHPSPAELSGVADHSATFFDPDNEEGSRLREQAAMETLDELLEYLILENGRVGILDATNSTIDRRCLIVRKIEEERQNFTVMFLESQCFDERLLESNMRLKLSGPDYKNHDSDSGLEDFKKRVAMYEKSYVPLGPWEERNGFPYCQMVDVGRKLTIYNISSYLATQSVQYLQHFNLFPRQIWLTRHGESVDDVLGRIGGDAELTLRGVKYAAALSRFLDHQKRVWSTTHDKCRELKGSALADTLQRSTADQTTKRFHVWTSRMRRSMQTAQFLTRPEYLTKHLRILNELNAGILEGLTREQVQDFYTEWYSERQKDKYRFRYPGTTGEGYLDVTNRLKSVILEVESMTDHILLISGLAVTRILLAYFTGLHRDKIVDLHFPIGELHMLEPKPYGLDHRKYAYNVESDWFELIA